ncbi:inactive beta-amylase 9-like [Bidens hawaiensis]|uniref:inactive beta-amylase 9-like n=1 Tax=Bidens hawaiensis TaxID=980011 RepID=UPI00404A2856
MSLIRSSPAMFPTTQKGFRQSGTNINNNNNNNSQMMIICSSATKFHKSFGTIIRCSHLPLYHSQSAAASTHASPDLTLSDHNDGVKLYVGLPMNSVSECNAISHSRAIAAGLRALKLLGVEGVELPIWWGVTEKESMGKYEWSGYLALADMVQKSGLKLHVSLCFHASKEDNIQLPKWVADIGELKPDIFFADRAGKRYKDCLSFGVDSLPVFDGKTAIELYQGFIESFKGAFAPFMGSTITGVTIGLGPNGELRYPSHHDQINNSVGHGAGEFQCYDENMMTSLKEHAANMGNPLWGLGGPHDAPSYNQQPINNTFFKEAGSWETAYGDFFLSWYSTELVSHADRMLSLAASLFNDTAVKVLGKLPLVPSWYRSRSHPAEVTAGFYNTVNRNGYEEIAKIFCKNSCRVILPGMDLLDEQQPNESFSSPEQLLADIKDACRNHNVEVCGQNLNVAGTVKNFDQIKKNLADENGIELFVYQRMGGEFFSPENFPLFTAFVRSLNQPEVDSDDLVVNDREGALLVPSKTRKLQAV